MSHADRRPHPRLATPERSPAPAHASEAAAQRAPGGLIPRVLARVGGLRGRRPLGAVSTAGPSAGPSAGQRALATRPATARPSRRHRRRFHPTRLLNPRYQLPALLLVTALATLFAWQARQPFALDLGAPNDAAYLDGFHAAETTPDGALAYRWTRDRATIHVPGYGATTATLTLRLQGARTAGEPPAITVQAGTQPATPLQLAAELRDYEIAVPASAFADGSLRVMIDAPTFQPPGDRRELGVVVDRVEVRDTGAPAGLIAPPLRVLIPLLLLALAAYGTPVLLLRSAPAGAVAGWLSAVTLLVFTLRSRFELALYAPDLAAVAVAVALAALLTGLALRRARRRWDWGAGERALGGAALIAGGMLLALLAGMRHPQYLSSDLMLNVHRLEAVRHGEWVFTLGLPGPRALEAPYPPLFYAVMLPFAALVPDKTLLVEVTAALAIAAGALVSFALGRRLTGEDGPALWAAGVYTFAPITYGMASAGNFANLFGQGVANAYLLALVLSYGRWHRPAVAAALTAGLALALLGHFGVFLSLVVTLPLVALVLALRGTDGRRQALALAASLAAALLVTYLLYYRFHTALLLGHLADALGGEVDVQGEGTEAELSTRLVGAWTGAHYWWGWPALALAGVGAGLLWRARRSSPLVVVLAWLASALLFALVELVAGLSVRYYLFVLPALAVVAGWTLWRLWHLRRPHRLAGPALALALGALWLWQALGFWTDRVLHAYH